VNAKHRDETSAAAERYGKHSEANADVSVFDVLQQAIKRGEAIRLAWSDEDSNRAVSDPQELPTAVLPVVRPEQSVPSEADDYTQPMNATSAARRPLWPRDFSWWPQLLAG
jgi:hypothetical protein